MNKGDENIFNHAEAVGIKNEGLEAMFMDKISENYNELAQKESELQNEYDQLETRYQNMSQKVEIKEALQNTESQEYKLLKNRMTMVGGLMEDVSSKIEDLKTEMEGLFNYKEMQMQKPDTEGLGDINSN